MQSITRQFLEEMNEKNHADFLLVNVLPRDTFNDAHIRTSVNIPHEDPDFVDTVERLAGSKDRTIVVYCANFECPASTRAAEKLDAAGFSHVFDYEGGTDEWLANHRHH